MGFTSRATLLVLVALVLCSGLESATRTKKGRYDAGVATPASPPLDDEALDEKPSVILLVVPKRPIFLQPFLPVSLSSPDPDTSKKVVEASAFPSRPPPPRGTAGNTCEMSEYQNVVGGRLKLKGKALDVKEGGVKKKKKTKKHREESSQIGHDELHEGGSSELPTNPNSELTEADKTGEEEGNPHPDYDHLTPAERRYMEQKQKIDMQKLAKVANKSHRDRIQDFNQYLANLSEHYDIPKVGPG
ncbi:protein FAM32A-like [Panicum miliaceum]|uniref:Protein FAM32A-like n=1 Tax=Panicum miliaceum TaxID=4540 RepID=A0A3L6RTX3_PANMI|nr:protein FAM32A-like [Panicum miliaceum]